MGWQKAITVSGASVALVGSIAGGIWTLEARYAKAGDVRSVAETVQQLRCDTLESKLQELELKKEYGQLTEYERARLPQLKREWQRVCRDSSIASD